METFDLSRDVTSVFRRGFDLGLVSLRLYRFRVSDANRASNCAAHYRRHLASHLQRRVFLQNQSLLRLLHLSRDVDRDWSRFGGGGGEGRGRR